MQIDKDEVIAGFGIKSIRDMLKRVKNGSFSPATMKDLLNAPDDKIEGLRLELLKRSLIEVAENAPHSGRDLFETTTLGNQLANASFIKRMPRAKAEKLLQEVLARAHTINERQDLTHSIDEIRIFGSYLGTDETLGDLDLAVKLAIRPHNKKDDVEFMLEHARLSGKRFSNFVDELFYGQRQVIQLLKNRSPYISIHEGSDPEKLRTNGIVVFPQ